MLSPSGACRGPVSHALPHRRSRRPYAVTVTRKPRLVGDNLLTKWRKPGGTAVRYVVVTPAEELRNQARRLREFALSVTDPEVLEEIEAMIAELERKARLLGEDG